MSRHILFFLSFLFPILLNAQDGKFIKIVGTSSLEVKAESMRVTITLTEIKRDEYQKIREKSIDEIKSELNANLGTIGYSISDLEEIWPPKKKYNKTNSENYYLTLKSVEDAKEISKFSIKGFASSNFEYMYPRYIEFDEYEQSLQAMKDAKRKADALAEFVGKKVGDVLNIEDKSTSFSKYSGAKKKASNRFIYSIIITYELLD